MNHCKHPYQTTSIMESKSFFCVAHVGKYAIVPWIRHGIGFLAIHFNARDACHFVRETPLHLDDPNI